MAKYPARKNTPRQNAPKTIIPRRQNTPMTKYSRDKIPRQKYNYENASGRGRATILGPLYFILYINDLLTHMPMDKILSYAVDTVIISTATS